MKSITQPLEMKLRKKNFESENIVNIEKTRDFSLLVEEFYNFKYNAKSNFKKIYSEKKDLLPKTSTELTLLVSEVEKYSSNMIIEKLGHWNKKDFNRKSHYLIANLINFLSSNGDSDFLFLNDVIVNEDPNKKRKRSDLKIKFCDITYSGYAKHSATIEYVNCAPSFRGYRDVKGPFFNCEVTFREGIGSFPTGTNSVFNIFKNIEYPVPGTCVPESCQYNFYDKQLYEDAIRIWNKGARRCKTYHTHDWCTNRINLIKNKRIVKHEVISWR
ncbi:MAG TPA: hypothetical protein VEC16_06885 [Alphaproteobacteria bacterium]|nr:hypothetical protein [Alphaproteobacteria bacterium]